MQTVSSIVRTLENTKNDYLQAFRERVGKVGGFGRKASTYNLVKNTLETSLIPLDESMTADEISKKTVHTLISFWFDTKRSISPRTAEVRVFAFRSFLRWLAEEERSNFSMPKGAEAMFGECKAVFTPNISTYDPEKLKKILENANDMTKLSIYLQLNTGMQYQDMSDMTPNSIQGEYVVWQRSKMLRKNPPIIHSKLWTETQALIEKCKAQTNPFNRLFLNGQKTPLVTHEADQNPTNSLRLAYHRTCKAAKVQLEFKQFRKWGATFIENNFGHEVQMLWRGEYAGSSKHYVKHDYETRLTPAIQAWGDRLRQDGVFQA